MAVAEANAMALRIENEEVAKMARELARRSGSSITEALTVALRAQLVRLERRARLSVRDQLLAIGSRCAAHPDLDDRSAQAILSYDELGLPR
jgi:antitoxin VapB